MALIALISFPMMAFGLSNLQMIDTSVPIVRLSGVSKHFGTTPVLDDVSFQLPAGMSAGLIGLNGAGKTTILKCILDFCDFSKGSIELFGMDHLLPSSRSNVAYLPERFVPPFYLTGREFLRAMLRMSGSEYSEIRAREMFASLQLSEHALDLPARTYSKGMTQKLGLAVSFLRGRSLLVLDEPMSGLDVVARACVKRELARLRSQGDTTILITTHALADMEEICDHMILLHDARIAYAGSPVEFRRDSGEPTLEQAFLRRIESTSRNENARHV
jgi:ABC-2 type transport system ATP-binding protein